MYCKELDKTFENKQEMFAQLKANKELLITSKKSEIKTKKNDFRIDVLSKKEANKALPNMQDGYVYAVISNTNYIDSHCDVHLDGSMSKTANEQQGKVFYVADHKLEVSSIIATKKNIEMYLQTLSFKDLGKEYEGNTQCLIFKIPEDKIMLPAAKQLFAEKEQMENSIRMIYVNIDLAVNSTDEDFKDEYKVWSEVYPKIANKEKADEIGYFWAVRELRIVNEGSMVLFGSNDATPTDSKREAVNNTSKNEPFDNTQLSIKLQKLLEITKPD